MRGWVAKLWRKVWQQTFFGEVEEEVVEVVAVEVARVPPVKPDVAPDPGRIGFLGTDGVVADADLGPHPVHEAPGASRRGRGGNGSTCPMMV
jgi:hypothetical protein